MAAALCWLVSGCGSGMSAAEVDRKNSFELMMAAAAAQSTEEAGFLFFAAQMRFDIDTHVYPPVEKGGDSPGVLMAALSASVGQSVGPRLKGDPVAMANVLKRLSTWTPKFPSGYDPGWKYQKALDEKAAAAVVAATQKKILQPLKEQSTLAANQEYRQCAKDLTDATEKQNRLFDTFVKSAGKPLSAAQQKEQAAAAAKATAAAKRMNELKWELVPESRWHARMNWNAEDYFQDPKVIALCKAIEADDVKEMERLIASGSDPNAVGKDGMTPLLWAFPDAKIERFECLLNHGADPNKVFDSDFGVEHKSLHPSSPGATSIFNDGCHAGETMVHLASRAPRIDYLKLVVKHGGDVNSVDKKTGETPLDIVLDRYFTDAKERVELLLKHHADLNHYCPWVRAYPAMRAVQEDRYDIALLLLESGANPHLYQPDGERKVIHYVLVAKVHSRQYTTEDFQKEWDEKLRPLVDWLAQHGETLEQAEKDEEKWAQMYKKAMVPEDHARIRQQIIDERNVKEKESSKGKD